MESNCDGIVATDLVSLLTKFEEASHVESSSQDEDDSSPLIPLNLPPLPNVRQLFDRRRATETKGTEVSQDIVSRIKANNKRKSTIEISYDDIPSRRQSQTIAAVKLAKILKRQDNVPSGFGLSDFVPPNELGQPSVNSSLKANAMFLDHDYCGSGDGKQISNVDDTRAISKTDKHLTCIDDTSIVSEIDKQSTCIDDTGIISEIDKQSTCIDDTGIISETDKQSKIFDMNNQRTIIKAGKEPTSFNTGSDTKTDKTLTHGENKSDIKKTDKQLTRFNINSTETVSKTFKPTCLNSKNTETLSNSDNFNKAMVSLLHINTLIEAKLSKLGQSKSCSSSPVHSKTNIEETNQFNGIVGHSKYGFTDEMISTRSSRKQKESFQGYVCRNLDAKLIDNSLQSKNKTSNSQDMPSHQSTQKLIPLSVERPASPCQQVIHNLCTSTDTELSNDEQEIKNVVIKSLIDEIEHNDVRNDKLKQDICPASNICSHSDNTKFRNIDLTETNCSTQDEVSNCHKVASINHQCVEEQDLAPVINTHNILVNSCDKGVDSKFDEDCASIEPDSNIMDTCCDVLEEILDSVSKNNFAEANKTDDSAELYPDLKSYYNSSVDINSDDFEEYETHVKNLQDIEKFNEIFHQKPIVPIEFPKISQKRERNFRRKQKKSLLFDKLPAYMKSDDYSNTSPSSKMFEPKISSCNKTDSAKSFNKLPSYLKTEAAFKAIDTLTEPKEIHDTSFNKLPAYIRCPSNSMQFDEFDKLSEFIDINDTQNNKKRPHANTPQDVISVCDLTSIVDDFDYNHRRKPDQSINISPENSNHSKDSDENSIKNVVVPMNDEDSLTNFRKSNETLDEIDQSIELFPVNSNPTKPLDEKSFKKLLVEVFNVKPPNKPANDEVALTNSRKENDSSDDENLNSSVSNVLHERSRSRSSSSCSSSSQSSRSTRSRSLSRSPFDSRYSPRSSKSRSPSVVEEKRSPSFVEERNSFNMTQARDRKARQMSRHHTKSRSRTYSRSRSPLRSHTSSNKRLHSRQRGKEISRSRSRSRRRTHSRSRHWTKTRTHFTDYSPVREKRDRSMSYFRRQNDDELDEVTKYEEKKIIYAGKLPKYFTRHDLRKRFRVFGIIEEVKLFDRDDGDNYGFVTFRYTHDAFQAVEKGNEGEKEKLDLCFGGRRHFCETAYTDLDNKDEDYEGYSLPCMNDTSQEDDFDSLLRKAQLSIQT